MFLHNLLPYLAGIFVKGSTTVSMMVTGLLTGAKGLWSLSLQRVSPSQMSSPSSPARAPCLIRIWWPWAAWPGTSCPAPFPSPGTTRTTLKSSRVSEPSQH
nr:immunoglobulin DSP2.9-Jh3-100 [Mus musculus]